MKMMKSARSAAGGAASVRNAKKHRHRKVPLVAEWKKTKMSVDADVEQNRNRDAKTAIK